jgi:hypothetical protein
MPRYTRECILFVPDNKRVSPIKFLQWSFSILPHICLSVHMSSWSSQVSLKLLLHCILLTLMCEADKMTRGGHRAQCQQCLGMHFHDSAILLLSHVRLALLPDAKLKCDGAQPSCSNCGGKGIACFYATA